MGCLSKLQLNLAKCFVESPYYIQHGRLSLDVFLKFIISNIYMQKIFKANQETVNNLDLGVEDEITYACISNLNKSKYISNNIRFKNITDAAICNREIEKLSKILEIKDEVLDC
jgi:hypothetical protein